MTKSLIERAPLEHRFWIRPVHITNTDNDGDAWAVYFGNIILKHFRHRKHAEDYVMWCLEMPDAERYWLFADGTNRYRTTRCNPRR
jgi:hypothetical protein